MEYINLKRQYKEYKEEIDLRIQKCMSNADFIMGNAVQIFERNLAEYIGVAECVSCGSGTDALQLIYMAYGIGIGDAVFCPDMTFVATVEPASLLGATPIFCEIERGTYNINVDSLKEQIRNVLREGKLTPKAIVAVDFLGNPANWKQLREVADEYSLLLIEDAAQGIGSSYHGRMCGSLADVAATSFFPSKPLGAYGDGGAVLLNDSNIAEVMRSLRVHGKGSTKYDNIRIGLNSRLDTIQAEILNIKLKHLPEEMAMRQAKARKYEELLRDYVEVPHVEECAISAYAQYVILLDERIERTAFMKQLKEKNVPSIVYYPNPLHLLPVYCGSNTYGQSFSNTEYYAKHNVGIPFSAFITDEEIEYVADVVRKCVSEK